MYGYHSAVGVGLIVLCAGCMQSLEEQTKKDPNSIIGKTTQNVGEFDPNAGAKVSQGNAPITTPGTGAVTVLANTMERLPTLAIEDALNKYNALEGRYPNTHEEFMTSIIKENNIRLPVLPAGKQYQYDVANHKLVIIDPAAPTESP